MATFNLAEKTHWLQKASHNYARSIHIALAEGRSHQWSDKAAPNKGGVPINQFKAPDENYLF